VPLADDNILLIKPTPGLMIWVLVTFLLVLFILNRYAFGRIAEMLDARRKAVHDNLSSAEEARAEAQRLLEEYKQQLAAARAEATEIVERARRTGEDERRRMQEDLAAERERGVAQAKEAIAAETRQSLDRIKTEMATLTLQATELVLRRKLDDAESKRLIDEALADVDFSKLSGEVE
jgi:F-type H+-transporting ATPase subunit b